MSGTARKLVSTLRRSGIRWTATVAADAVLPLGLTGRWADRVVTVEQLDGQVRAILRAWGMPDADADVTVTHMRYADVHGIDSHGCSMLMHYHRGIAQGWMTATPTIELVQETETTALIDGGQGFGHVVSDRAMRLAIEKARASGLAAVSVRNSGHFGAAGCYAALAAAEGLIGLATTNARVPALVATHGKEAVLGTNPIAFAAPSADAAPFLLDMATSTASVGKIFTAWRKGQPIPQGVALDAAGQPLTDGRTAGDARRLTPLGSTPELGSHKGYGLAVMVEILSALLSGSAPLAGTPAPAGIGHFFLAVDPGRFRDPRAFEQDVARLSGSLRAATPADPKRPVLVAGDPERAIAADRQRAGIPLTRAVIEDIRTVAAAAGAPFLLDPDR